MNALLRLVANLADKLHLYAIEEWALELLRKRGSPWVGVLVLGALLLPGAAFAQTQDDDDVQCQGVERWEVKVGRDPGALHINPNQVIDTTIEALNEIEPVCTSNPEDAARQLQETKVYRVHARLKLRRLEWRKNHGVFKGDYDFHNVLASHTSSATIVAEAPHPACAQGSFFFTEIAAARQQDTDIPVGSDVVATGVLFFDFFHNQTGHAKPHPCKGQKIKLVAELHWLFSIVSER